MRLFRQCFRNRAGVAAKTERWYVGIIVGGAERRLPAFTDKRASEELGRRCEDLANLRTAGGQPDAAQLAWIERLPQRLRERLARIGVLDARGVASAKPLREHLVEYRQAILDDGGTAKHADMTAQRVRAVLDGIGAAVLADVRAADVTRYLAERRADGLSIASGNHYLRAVKSFCGWLVKERRATENPLAYLRALNAATDKRHERRALEPAELQRLLTATRDGPTRYGMDGPARCWLYRLAVETGLRSGELRSLTRGSFVLDGPEPTVTVAAAYSKRRRDDTLPLRPGTASELRGFLAGKLPTARAFTMPEASDVAVMLRADLSDTGIAYRDGAGRVLDFHALRATCATLLVSAGVDVKTAQTLLRHSSPVLTLGVYAKRLRGTERDAIARLPDLSRPAREAARATGTDNIRADVSDGLPSDLPSSLPESRAWTCKAVQHLTQFGGNRDVRETQAGVDRTCMVLNGVVRPRQSGSLPVSDSESVGFSPRVVSLFGGCRYNQYGFLARSLESDATVPMCVCRS